MNRVRLARSVALLCLAACAPARAAQLPPTVVLEIPPATPSATGTSTPVSSPTPRPSRTFTPSPTASATHAPSLTPTPRCLESAGSLAEYDVPSPVADYPMRTRVYLPPCYGRRPDLAYPVLYLLHGQGHTQATWDELGVNEAADELIASGEAPPLIIVMPREVGGERFGQAVVEDLLPVVEANFRTIPWRAYRALGGMSRGGGWTVRIGLQYPHLFGALGLHSLAIFFADEARVNGWLDSVPEGLMPRFYVDIGEVDGLIVSAEHMHELLSARGIDHVYIVQPGGHSERYWSAHVAEYLRWYAEGWRDAPLRIQEVESPAQE